MIILVLCNTIEATITLYLQNEQTRFEIVYCAVYSQLFQNEHCFLPILSCAMFYELLLGPNS